MPRILSFPVYGVFNGGLNTRDDPRTLPLNKSPNLRNVELRRTRVETTPGYTAHSGTDSDTAASQGIFVARYQGNVYVLKADGGKIKKLKVVGSSPDSSWATLKSSLSTTAQVEFAQANNVVYIVNGVDTAQKWDLATTPANTSNATLPLAKTIAYFKQRLVTSNGDRLDFSNIGAYETFVSFKYADQGEGGTIQRVLDNGHDELTVMKDNGRYGWDGVDTSTSNPRKWSSRGTIAPRSVVLLPDGSVVYADHEGVWRGNGFTDDALSGEIDPTWDALNHSRLDKAAAKYLTLVFDLSLDGGVGGWLRHDIPANCWESYIDTSGVNQLIFGSPAADSKVFRRYAGSTASEFNFNSAAINALYYTKEFDFHEVAPEAAGRSKVCVRLAVSAKQQGDYNLTVGWRKDNEADFITALWSLAGVGSSTWAATPSASDVWADSPGPTDIWEGAQKVEGIIPSFSNVRGRTLQTEVLHNAINEPIEFYGETIYLIPLRGFN
jgi:hypothetical protein